MSTCSHPWVTKPEMWWSSCSRHPAVSDLLESSRRRQPQAAMSPGLVHASKEQGRFGEPLSLRTPGRWCTHTHDTGSEEGLLRERYRHTHHTIHFYQGSKAVCCMHHQMEMWHTSEGNVASGAAELSKKALTGLPATTSCIWLAADVVYVCVYACICICMDTHPLVLSCVLNQCSVNPARAFYCCVCPNALI